MAEYEIRRPLHRLTVMDGMLALFMVDVINPDYYDVDDDTPAEEAVKVAKALAVSFGKPVDVHLYDVDTDSWTYVRRVEPNEDHAPPEDEWLDPENYDDEAGLIDCELTFDNWHQATGYEEAVDVLQPRNYRVIGRRGTIDGKVMLFIEDDPN